MGVLRLFIGISSDKVKETPVDGSETTVYEPPEELLQIPILARYAQIGYV